MLTSRPWVGIWVTLMFKYFQASFVSIIISEHLLQEVNQLPHALSVARRSEDFLFERTLLVQLQQHHLQEGVEQKCGKHFLLQKTDQVRWRVQSNLIVIGANWRANFLQELSENAWILSPGFLWHQSNVWFLSFFQHFSNWFRLVLSPL